MCADGWEYWYGGYPGGYAAPYPYAGYAGYPAEVIVPGVPWAYGGFCTNYNCKKENYYWYADDIRTTTTSTAQACSCECTQQSGCQAWSFYTSNGWCGLKSSATGGQNTNGYTSGSKYC